MSRQAFSDDSTEFLVLQPVSDWDGAGYELTCIPTPLHFPMMTNLSIPRSGLRASEAKLSTSAHNTANLTTDAFARQRVTQVEASTGAGTRSRVDTVQLSPEALRRAEHLPGPQNNVRVVSQTIDRISAQRAFETNVRVAQAQNRLSQTLIDITA